MLIPFDKPSDLKSIPRMVLKDDTDISNFTHFSWDKNDIDEINLSPASTLIFLQVEQLMSLLISDVVHVAWNSLRAKLITKKAYMEIKMALKLSNNQNFIMNLIEKNNVNLSSIPSQAFYCPKLFTTPTNDLEMYEGDVSFIFTKLDDATCYMMRS